MDEVGVQGRLLRPLAEGSIFSHEESALKWS